MNTQIIIYLVICRSKKTGSFICIEKHFIKKESAISWIEDTKWDWLRNGECPYVWEIVKIKL